MKDIDLEHLRKFVAPEFVFGWGARNLVARYAQNLVLRRVLIVTDPGVIAAGWVADVQKLLQDVNVDTFLFDNVTPNPKDHEVAAGESMFRGKRCEGIIAVGGGSPIDCAKGIGIVAANGGSIVDYEGVDLIPAAIPPLICIPTTAGTGADLSQFAIITNTASRKKITLISKTLIPDVALIDAETTVSMDPELTATTGLDTLAHAIEALASNAASPFTDLAALEAVRLTASHLHGAQDNPNDREHRTQMLLAATMAGMAFSNASLGAVHAMSHPLGGHLDLIHGQVGAILLKHVVDFNWPAVEERYERLADPLGLKIQGLDPFDRRRAILAALQSLIDSVGLSRTLSDLNVSRADIPGLAAAALSDPCLVTNPRHMNQADVEGLYERAL